ITRCSHGAEQSGLLAPEECSPSLRSEQPQLGTRRRSKWCEMVKRKEAASSCKITRPGREEKPGQGVALPGATPAGLRQRRPSPPRRNQEAEGREPACPS